MDEITTVKQLIDCFPTRQALADTVSRKIGVAVSAERVHGWAKAGSIPARFHRSVVLAAGDYDLSLTADLLDALHAPTQHQGDAA